MVAAVVNDAESYEDAVQKVIECDSLSAIKKAFGKCGLRDLTLWCFAFLTACDCECV